MKKKLWNRGVVFLVLLCSFGWTVRTAKAAEVSASLPVASQYVWRGLQANPDPVLQPSLTVAGGGLSFNLWGNMDLTGYGEKAGYGNRSGEFTELDLTLEYGLSLGPLGLDAGVISYVFPGLAATTHEVYGKVSADVFANPSLAVFSDVDEIQGSYFLLSLSHSFALAGLEPFSGADLGLSCGYGSASYLRGYFGLDKAAPVDLLLTLGIPLDFGGIALTPSLAYSYLLDAEIRELAETSGYFVAALSLGLTL